ncbi:hypothetical protein FVE85_1658 [Porphyridium purpureum]|uniref:Uncharacterized protein n=1 Tax=Porphyridium purpureum TaxID=35688 RepID=A0A5J4YXW0_PORPP|nr:hypothetical protein FVE85_1658 [Porphyridium purpureum]|eukprot:POR9795..scf209_3
MAAFVGGLPSSALIPSSSERASPESYLVARAAGRARQRNYFVACTDRSTDDEDGTARSDKPRQMPQPRLLIRRQVYNVVNRYAQEYGTSVSRYVDSLLNRSLDHLEPHLFGAPMAAERALVFVDHEKQRYIDAVLVDLEGVCFDTSAISLLAATYALERHAQRIGKSGSKREHVEYRKELTEIAKRVCDGDLALLTETTRLSAVSLTALSAASKTARVLNNLDIHVRDDQTVSTDEVSSARMFDEAHVILDHLVTADAVQTGNTFAAREVMKRALQEVGTSAPRATFITASAQNARAARRLGFHSVIGMRTSRSMDQARESRACLAALQEHCDSVVSEPGLISVEKLLYK